MQQGNTIVGLDVGSTKISAVVGTINEGLIQVIGAALVPSAGVRKGVVTEIEECVSAISSVIEQAERMAGVPLQTAVIGIGGPQVNITNSKGVIAVSRPDGEISANDVNRVIDASRAVALPPNREILHVIPKDFTIDGQETVKDPVGMLGVRLETEALVIGVGSAALRNLTRCVNQAGLNVDSLVFSPLATAESLLNKRQKEAGVMMLDIGGGTTGMVVYEEGALLHATVIPVGSMHITNDLAIGLQTSIDAAEKVKKEHGYARISQTKDQTIDLSKLDPNEEAKVKQKEVAEIIEARLKELFEKIAAELRSIDKESLLPAGVVLTGGGSQLKGLTAAVKEELHLPAKIGNPIHELAGAVDKIDSPVYATSVGLMLTGINRSEDTPSSKLGLSLPSGLKGMADKAKSLLQQFLP